MADRTVSVTLRAIHGQYVAAMAQAKASTKGLGSEITAVSTFAAKGDQSLKALGVAGVATAGVVALGFVKAGSAAAAFEKQMSGVQAVADASASEMQKLSDAAIAAGASTKIAGVTAMDAAKAEAELVKAGVSVADVLGGALTGSLTLAAAGQLEFGAAAEIAAQSMNIFGLAGGDVVHIADLLAAAANKSAGDVSGFGDSLRQGGLVAAQTGLSIEETVGALAAFADSALTGSDAGTSLKTALQRLTPQSDEAAGMMEQLGFSAYDAQGNFIGLEGLAGELQSSFAGLDGESRNAALGVVFGSDAIRGASVLMEQGAEGIRDYIAAVDDTGAAARMSAIQMDNLSGDVEALGGVIESALIDLGSQGTGALRDLTQMATGAASTLADLPGPMKAAAGAGAGLVGTVGLLGGGFLLLAPRVQQAYESFKSLSVAAPRTAGALKIVGGAAGGVGIALTAGTIIAGLYGKAKAEAAAKVEELTSALESDNGVIGENTRLTAVNRLEKEGILEAADKLGISLSLVTEAAIGNSAAQSMLNDQLGGFFQSAAFATDGSGELTKAHRDLEDGVSGVNSTLDSSFEALDRQSEAMLDVDYAALRVNEALGGTGSAMLSAAGFSAALAEGLDEATRANWDLHEALPMTKEQLDEQAKAWEALGEAIGEFTDGSGAYESALDAKTEAARTWAEEQAENTEDAGDSWEDFYGTVTLTAAEWITSLEEQVEAQRDWKQNLAVIAATVGPAVAGAMADLGPAGAEQVALLSEMGPEEMRHAGDLIVAAAHDGVQRTGEEFETEMAVVAALAGAGALDTADAIANNFGLRVADVERIAAHYGVAMQSGLRGVLSAVGLNLDDPNVRAAIPNFSTYAAGGVEDHYAQIATAGAWRVWAEPETGGEAYIPLAPAKRDRSLGIWEETGRRLGVFAEGGFSNAASVPAPPDVSGYGAYGYGTGRGMAAEYGIAKAAAEQSGIGGGDLVGIGRSLQALGFNVSRHGAFGGTPTSGHAPNSKHYRDRAIDVNWYPASQEPGKLDDLVGKLDRSMFSEFLWRTKGHYDHLHLAMAQGGLVPGLATGGVVRATPGGSLVRLGEGGRDEAVIPFADGGIVNQAIHDTQFRGALKAEGLAGAARGGFSKDEAEAVANAWVDLALAVDEATANMLLALGLTADGFADAAGRIVDYTAEATRAQEKAAEEAAEAAEEDYQRRRAINDNLFELGLLSTEDHLANLDRRMAREVQFSDEWMALHQERERVLDDIVDAEQKAADAIADTQEKAQAAADKAVDRLRSLMVEEASIRGRMTDLAVNHFQAMAAAEEQFVADRQGVIDQRVSQLDGWMSAEERFVAGWGNTAGALTRNLGAQLEAFTAWSAELDEARARGVSDETIDLLGLADGPEALAQLRTLNGATVAEVEALNAAVAARRAAASGQAASEAAQAYSEIGGVLVGIAERHREAVASLVSEFLEEQAALTGELANLGLEQGASYGSSIAAGLTSQIPAIRAAAAEAQAALGALQSATAAQESAIAGMFAARGLVPNAGDVARIAAEVAAGRSLADVSAGLDFRASVPQYATGVATVPYTGLATLHQGERVLSVADNRALVAAVQGLGQKAPVVQVYLNGVERQDVRVIVDGRLREMNANAAIAGVR